MPAPVSWLSAFQANTGTSATGTQSDAQIIGLSNGNILVAWQDGVNGAVGTPFNQDIIGTVYDPIGNVVAAPFQINTLRTQDDQTQFDIEATNDGGFMIAYRSETVNFANTVTEIVWERYDASGSSINNRVIVSESSGARDLKDPQLSNWNGADDFQLSWTDTGSGAGDVMTTNFSGAGIALNPVRELLGSYSALADGNAHTAISNGGVQLVSFETIDGPTTHITLEMAAGTTSFWSSAVTSGAGLTNTRVAATTNGMNVVTWDDPSGTLNYRIFNNSGVPQGAVSQVSGASNVSDPDVIGLQDGSVVLVWNDTIAGDVKLAVFLPIGGQLATLFTAQSVFSTAGGTLDVEAAADGRILISQTNAAGEVEVAVYDTRGPNITAAKYDNNANGRQFRDTDVITGYINGGDLSGDTDGNAFYGTINGETFYSGVGADTFYSGGGFDTLSYELDTFGVTLDLQTKVVSGGYATGDDIGTGLWDRVIGSAGNDSIQGSSWFDELFGGNGADTIRGGAYADLIEGGADDDSINGGSANDTLRGDGGADTIEGSIGNDTIEGGTEDDVLLGEDGHDSVLGEEGSDTLTGGIGNDTLIGGVGKDSIEGGDDDDLLNGGLGADTLHGGSGNDEINAGDSNDLVTGGIGDDLLKGQYQQDTLSGGVGNDTLNGADGGDVLNGGNDDDLLQGGIGSDTLNGGDGNDFLRGQNQRDTLNGGAGDDTLEGGQGGEVFVFANGFGNDIITDFNASNAEDIDLSDVTAITGFNDLMNNHLSFGGSGNAVITVGSNSITLQGVTVSDIGAGLAYSEDDFIF